MASRHPSEPPSEELLSAVPPLQVSESTGLKLTVRYGAAGNSSQQTIYLQGDRKRSEYRNSFGRTYGPRLVSITRCDLGQFFELNLDSSEYTSTPKPLTQDEIEKRGLQNPTTYVSDKPTLRIEVPTTDTCERKEIFGHIARHVVTTRKQISLEGSQLRAARIGDRRMVHRSQPATVVRPELACGKASSRAPSSRQGHTTDRET